MSTEQIKYSRSAGQSVAFWLVLLSVPGCSGGVKDPFTRIDLSGRVSLDGQPVGYGEVAFRAAAEEGVVEVPQAVLAVRSGSFATSASQRPGVGKNEILVTIYSGDPPVSDESDDVDQPDPQVVGYWQTERELTDGAALSFDLKKSELKRNPLD